MSVLVKEEILPRITICFPFISSLLTEIDVCFVQDKTRVGRVLFWINLNISCEVRSMKNVGQRDYSFYPTTN